MLPICVVRATSSHYFDVARNMRAADRQEVWAGGHVGPLRAVVESAESSDMKWTILYEEKPIAIFGVRSMTTLSDIGIPWLLGTNGLVHIYIPFLRGTKRYMDLMHTRYRVLKNVVDARNEVAIKWLKWAGFEFSEAIKYGPDNLLFYPFEHIRV